MGKIFYLVFLLSFLSWFANASIANLPPSSLNHKTTSAEPTETHSCVRPSSLHLTEFPKDRNLNTLIEVMAAKMQKDLSHSIGAAGTIIYKNEILYLKTFGKTHKKGKEITPNTYFALGSVSKPICAFVAVDMAKSTKISLDGPLTLGFPPLAPKTVQLEQVLAHTTGHFYKGNSDIERGKNREVILNNLFTSKSTRAGEKFLYNNAAFSLLENVVEKYSGVPWPEAFNRTFSKYGPIQLALSNPPPGVEVAHPHHYIKRRRRFIDLGPVPRNYPQTVSSAAGVYASIQGLQDFMKLQLSGKFDDLHEPKILARGGIHFGKVKVPCPKNQILSQYALGWRVMNLKADETGMTRMIFHGGWLNGVNAFIGFLPKHQLAIAIVANDDRFVPQNIGLYFWTQVIAPLIGQKMETP